MSQSAGTLQTTHQATFIPPRHMPGYKGHCPTLKFDYGETYGNATAKHFQDYRSETLNQSKSPYANGGQFPTVYSHNPDMVIGARDRTNERWRTAPNYALSSVNHDRKDELDSFNQMAQQHREHYKDRTGTIQRVDEFLIPKKAEDMYSQDKPTPEEELKLVTGAESTRMMNSSVLRGPEMHESLSRDSTVRDRAMRDVYFEKR